MVGSATAAALGLSLNGGSVSAAAATESEAYLLAQVERVLPALNFYKTIL